VCHGEGLAVDRSLGLIVVAGGVLVVVVGLLMYSGALSWFGRLPGDIRYESGNVRVYVPIVSMLLVSVVLTVLFSLLRRFF
jgi:hypothetical protein